MSDHFLNLFDSYVKLTDKDIELCKQHFEFKSLPKNTIVEEEVEAKNETTAPKKTIESIVKETFFTEIEKLTNENNELKAKLELLTKVDAVAEESTELSDIKPISFNPENAKEIEFHKIGAKRPRNTMDSILEKFNK